ncbi:MAG TPA: DMT family transporter [Methylibium sp.]|nr:DMT family transporter [Methylibium sp.]
MASAPERAALLRAMPLVFVLIWSTGFIVARYGMPHAPPMKFLALRYTLSLACFGLWVLLAQAAWPRGGAQWRHLAVIGVLMHGGYLGGVWAAVKAGLGAGAVSLIVGLQPVLTALWVSAAGDASERVSARQWAGLALGFGGLVLVVGPKLGRGELGPWALVLAVGALLGITAGTLYQKRHLEPCDVRTASCVQLLAALAVTAPLALLETEAMDWQPALVGALAWSVLGLTLGGASLLYLLIQRGAATSVTTLLYLVPPCTATMAWLLFDEPLTPAVLLGFAVTAAGVALVVRGATPPPASS